MLRLLVCASLLLTACDPGRAAPGPPGPAGASAGSPRPSSLPTAEQERAVAQALASVGVLGISVTPSKFEWLFGSVAPRSGVFSGTLEGAQVWADVHFLEAPTPGLTACATRSTSGESVFTISLKGRPQVARGAGVTGALAGAGPMYFASSDQLFVMTPDARLRDALRPALGLAVPSCLWREPETLPVFPWERAVIDAFDAQQIAIGVIGGSKFESFLGDRREARVFGAASGQGGADVISLAAPLREIRMCSSPSSPGFTKWSVIVDGKELSGMDGSQLVYPLVGARFFVLAWDRASADALARGLGLSAPAC